MASGKNQTDDGGGGVGAVDIPHPRFAVANGTAQGIFLGTMAFMLWSAGTAFLLWNDDVAFAKKSLLSATICFFTVNAAAFAVLSYLRLKYGVPILATTRQ
ncbi:hypothetical protein DFJ73DRAFT_864910 [Zopfochytrium polystomum]|nr:hypothetical protein DFJ73DRAFT_864910 [Zopfochytrium polystomum]